MLHKEGKGARLQDERHKISALNRLKFSPKLADIILNHLLLVAFVIYVMKESEVRQ
ncbi:hypothetical protein KHA80_07580 [Anaerobacillus sp. HL2]|nr:hypothetical protein KHA80_07580 [Anaerobacillus sp. HL2]